MSGCPSRSEVQAEVWLNSGLPEDLCKAKPELASYGIYRQLNSGKFELISYCSQIQDASGKRIPALQSYVSMSAQKFNAFLDQLLPKQ